MRWIDFVWPMISAASFTVAAIHLVIWLKQKSQPANVLFALTAASVGIVSILELFLMRAQTPEQYEHILRWAHVPIVVMVIGMVGFVFVHFRAGSIFLAVATCLTRIACLLPNFLSGANLNFVAVTKLGAFPIWGGGVIAIPVEAIPNPWMTLGHVNVILLVLFLISAIIGVWRRGSAPDRRRVVLVCGSMVLFTAFAGEWAWAVVHGHVHGPLMFSPAFLCVLLSMGYELGGDMLRATQMAKNLLATELTLRDTERRMDLAVHAAGIGLWNLDMVGGNSWLSDHARLLLGFGQGDSSDMPQLIQRMHPDDRDRFYDSLREAAQGSGDFRREFRIVLPNRTTRWIVMRGQVESDSARAPTRVDGVFIDITEHKHDEERFRLVVETAPTALLMIDAEGIIALANQQAEALFGSSRTELIGMSVDLIVPARSRRRLKSSRMKSMLDTSPLAVGNGHHLFGLRSDGTEVPVEITLNPIPMESGRYVLVSIKDLSERNRLEQESALQRDELAHLSRVAMLAELSSSLAHELNQPLTAILANAQAAARFLAKAPPDLDEVRDTLSNIVESDKRAGEVIRRLRALLRKEKSDYRYLDVNEVVLDVLRIIRSDLLNRSVEVALELAPDLPLVHGDKVQLQQVLLNLLMNASDAMNDVAQGRTLSVRTALSSTDRVDVSVSDAGRGIPADDIERIFQPFVSSKQDGLGLGLAVCSTIISAHAGTLWAANNAGPGATVSFSLPVHGNLEPRARASAEG